jgi:5-methylcytosine-specific restriction protein A
MPYRAKHGCAVPGCPELTSERYCEAHAKQREKEYDSRRGSSAERGYDYRWQRLRKMYLREHPLCVDPDKRHVGQVKVATDVDHIIPKRDGGTDDESNLQALCKPCHSRKTANENAGHVFA